QETRLYDPDRDETRSMRSKEDAQDYRYFPDPDLLPLSIEAAWIDRVRAELPELPDAMQQRFTDDFGLSMYDAGVLTASRDMARYFLDLLPCAGNDAKLCANWVSGELAAALHRESLEIQDSRVSPQQLGGLLKRVQDGTISGKMAKELFDVLWREGGEADALIEARGLKQISDVSSLERIVEALMAEHPAQVAEYRAGKEKVFGFFVGRAMKASGGRANPEQLNAVLKQRLKAE
ncbi:MAG: Asp-tRNA(Asn)/Glu-tRNA(Gln) amidotransferase GatCAB subunit B, partial [Betaproteobacteria bacterium]|nr:Asp-tRNA(Asn)/Glu-tRNA(Gln) amidotransferase GatCAB subunit B [Betaproteobacteria bacterium]